MRDTISKTLSGPTAGAQPFSPEELHRRTLEQWAVEAAIWGMPIVSVDAMREAVFRDAKANYNDVVFYSQPADWKLQMATPNNSTRYIFSYFNAKEEPVVAEIPAAVGAALFGTFLDAWQAPLADIGAAGEDQGQGGKYLLLPPDYRGDIPAGHIAVPSQTSTGFAVFRAISKTSSAADVANAIALVKEVRLYPLSQAANPPQTRHVDIYGKLLDGIVRMDESFYARLPRMVNEEPMQPRDKEVMGMLKSLGIEKGKEFEADAAMQAVLKDAIREAHAWLMEELLTYGERYWPGGRWDNAVPPVAVKTAFKWETPGYFDTDARGIVFFVFCAPPAKLGAATFYLGTFHDVAGQRLHGENTYRLRVPANVPAQQFWAVTVYDLETASFFRESPRQSIDSYDQKVKKNADGSVDVYFGPKPPASQESNWLYTASGKTWFPYFRFYGPEKPLFEKTWKLPDIEVIK